MSATPSISILLYNRLTSYLHYLRNLPSGGPDNISSTTIANALGMGDVQVRKDLAAASSGGRPKLGYITRELVADLEHFLGYDNCTDAVLMGAGNLGKALLSYENFQHYGLKIVAAFDSNPALAGEQYSGVRILSSEKTENLCRRLKIHVGIITVPAAFAQQACDQLIAGGVRAIWNFAPANLKVPETVIVKNEDMAASLALLTNQLTENIAQFGLN